MVYSTSTDVHAQVSGMATGEAGATGFVQRLLMQKVLNVLVLKSQARSALFPDAVISPIPSQLNLPVTYTPLICMKVRLNLMDPDATGCSISNHLENSK
ncbi:hypothetical protein KIN20_016348 [Parelaphostrongylus tenuis]|uniref:Uncharacterized protein n=1 Tax=Parelaphostrongylus tenuis TaxID=148309 RepID=A0AAD5MJW0_PARTN|nr:hypothetical protein KIN20_016348 [Parelaphostrongylus tenuis]